MTTVKFTSGADSVEFSFDKNGQKIITLTQKEKLTVFSMRDWWNLQSAKRALQLLKSGDIASFCKELQYPRLEHQVSYARSEDLIFDTAYKLTNLNIEFGYGSVTTLTDRTEFWFVVNGEGKETEDRGITFRPNVELVRLVFTISVQQLKQLAELIASVDS